MELLDGQTLLRRIGGRPLPSDLALDLALQIADALEAALPFTQRLTADPRARTLCLWRRSERTPFHR